jgi:hypothetical protein
MAASPEQRKQYHVTKDFKGINTKANRTSIAENEFAWLENAQPIGAGNLKVTPAQVTVNTSSNVAVVWANTVSHMDSCNINSSDYVVAFKADGSAEAFNIGTSTLSNVAAAGTFSASGVQMTQWKDERAMIIDPANGLYTWDGTSRVSIGSVGTIAVTAGGSGYTSAPSVQISAPNQANGVQATAVAFITANAVSSIALTEAGTGYTSAPTVTLSGGGGSNAAAIASYTTFKTGTVSVTVLNGGTGYTNAANITVSFSGGGGTNAAATAVTSGNIITQIVMTNPGAGYTSAPTVTITGGGGSNAVVRANVVTDPNVDVATFSGRVWIAQGRNVYYSAANSYSDFTSVSAGTITLTDSTLHNKIRALLSANNFLYIFGDDSINVFSDVRVTNTGTTLFTNTNVSASVGSRRINAIFPNFRYVLFLNQYGIYALVGSTTSKISDALDGIFPLIDFTQPVYGGQVLLNNILCAAFNFYYNDPVAGLRPIQAVFFDRKWFVTSQGTIKYTSSVSFEGQQRLYGSDGTNLVRLYGNSTSNVSSTIKSALWPMGDPIRDKQALKFGVEAIISQGGGFTATVDSEVGSSPPYNLADNQITWTNIFGNTISWTNNASAIIGWINSGYQLYKSDAQQWGKYLGLTLSSNSAGIVVSTLEMEHELRARF